MKRMDTIITAVGCCLFCLTMAAFGADGFGAATTGGQGGNVVPVSTASAFKAAVESTSTNIVQVSGTIDLGSVSSSVDIRSNKTITGITAGAKIIGRLAFTDDASNVIIENLIITNPANDGISVRDRITNVFITKCTFYDCGDGCVDITTASDYVTVSWCKFYYIEQSSHRFVNLIGGDYPEPDDIGKLHVTFHHNWWASLCHERMPSVRYGRVHLYNNYYDCYDNNYCVRSRVDAQCLIENNYFDHVKDPHVRYVEDTNVPPGEIYASGNIYHLCTGKKEDGDTVFTPPYPYVIGSAGDVPTIVETYAGAETPDPPHWLYLPYGDFTRDGTVDGNDLRLFVDYWLKTSDIDDADYNSDGNVNFYEFALMAENWMEP
jgi:pectate lyase